MSHSPRPFAATFVAFAVAIVLASADARAQQHQHQHPAPPPTPAPAAEPATPPPVPPHTEHDHAAMTDPVTAFFMQQSSGTSTQPSAWPMPMRMFSAGGWDFSLMAQAFLAYTEQSGPRGRDAGYSTNWMMGSASRRLGPGRLQMRVMASLEPATVRGKRYPLLFQTGERADGVAIVDGQHPHDFIMEASLQYAFSLGRAGLGYVYYAPVGDVALGPVAFPHRASAMELPQATLGHHWQDSTHIASNVATVGWQKGGVRFEASAFHGTEPDEDRWDVDGGAMNSWAARLTWSPTAQWTVQASHARIERPEAAHPDNVDRTTASVHHVLARPGGRSLATSVIWATNRKSVAQTRTHAVTIETLVPVTRRDLVTARFEWSQRDELFEDDHHLADEIAAATGKRAFGVSGLTVGYTREVAETPAFAIGVGANVTRYWTDRALRPYYGGSPWGATGFVRVRLK